MDKPKLVFFFIRMCAYKTSNLEKKFQITTNRNVKEMAIVSSDQTLV